MRRRGLGISLSDEASSGAEPTLGDLVLAARDGIASNRAFAQAAAAARTPEDLAAVAAASETERDAGREKALKVVRVVEGFASGGTLATLVALGVMTGGTALLVGAVVAAVVLAVEAGAWVLDQFEDDPDSADERARATAHAEWFATYGLPWPKFHKPRHGDVRSYANELEELRQTIERLSSDPVREAIWRAGANLKAGVERSPVVIATFVVAGENGRNWGYVHHLADEDRRSTSAGTLVSNREAIELLQASIGILAAEAQNLPATHVQMCVDSAALGWETGVGEVPGEKLAGIVAFGYAQLFAESTAADWRARLDAVEAEAPGFASRILNQRRATVYGGTLERLGGTVYAARGGASSEPNDPDADRRVLERAKPSGPAPRVTNSPGVAIHAPERPKSTGRAVAGVLAGLLTAAGIAYAARR